MIPSDRLDILKKVTANTGDMNCKRRVISVVEKINPEDSDLILDSGCGDGLFLVAISEICKCRLVGIDLDKKNLRLANGYLKGKSVRLIYGNITNLPFPDCYFDKVYCSEVLEHVSNDKKAVSEMKRVLKKNGKLVITVPNKNYPFIWDPINKILESLFHTYIKSGFWAGIWNKHLRLYSIDEISDLLKENKFKILDRQALTHYCVPFNHIFLYALKQIKDSGILPKKIFRTSEKFYWKEKNQSKIIKFGYFLLNMIDRLNDGLSVKKSSVNILIESQKL